MTEDEEESCQFSVPEISFGSENETSQLGSRENCPRVPYPTPPPLTPPHTTPSHPTPHHTLSPHPTPHPSTPQLCLTYILTLYTHPSPLLLLPPPPLSLSPLTPLQCWETFVGQELYKLGLINFVLSAITTLSVETARK